MFKLKPKWILITSLFYDGPVEAKIKIKDYSRQMGEKKYRQTYYNIYSLNEVKKISNRNGYDLTDYKPFILPFDIEKPEDKGRGTYTIKLHNGYRIQISGPLIMPWYTPLLKKMT